MNRIVLMALLGWLATAYDWNALGENTAAARPPVAFRVTTTIYAGKDEAPAAKHLVLFHDSLVYDLPEIDDSVVTVYDPPRKRVILIDRATQVRTTIATDDLIRLTAQIRAAATDDRARTRLGLDAVVEPIVVDPKSGEAAPLVLDEETASIASDGFMTSYGSVRYEVLTQTPRQASVATQYGQFADWAMRLNVVRRIGLAPFGRMNLNDRITAAGQMPRETRLTIRGRLTSDHYRSTHELIEQLSEHDRRQISDVGGMLALYREVPLEEFP